MSGFSKLKTLISRALITSVDDTTEMQTVQVSGCSGESIDAERVQPYGLSANPPVDSEALVTYPSADHEQGVIFACDCGQWRIKGLKSGEVALYSQYEQKVLLKNNGDIETTFPGLQKFGNGSDFVAMAQKVDSSIDAIVNAISAAVTSTVPDGGALFKSNIMSALTPALEAIGSVASTNVKAD
jgi:phage gp45-like